MIDHGQAGVRTRAAAEKFAQLVNDRFTGRGWVRVSVAEVRALTGLPASWVRRASVYAQRCGLVKLSTVAEYGILIAKPGKAGTKVDLKPIPGYLYVIEFTGNVVKVGYSSNPNRRLNEHRNTAAVWSQVEIRHLVSNHYDNARAAEGYLIEAAKFFGVQVNNEWFKVFDSDGLFERITPILKGKKK